MNKKVTWLFFAGTCAIVGGVIYMGSSVNAEHVTALITMGLAMITVGILTILDIPQRRIQDERTRYLGAMAASYSWVITICSISILVLLVEFAEIGIGPQDALGILLFEMLLSFKVCTWYLGKKGVILDSDAYAYKD